MKVDWVIENWTKEQSYEDLCRAILEQGHQLTKLFDFKKSDWLHWRDKCVVFNGSIQMTKMMRDTLLHCAPVAWNTEQNYLCSKYYTFFGDLLFNDRYAMASLREVTRNKFFYYGVLGKEAQIFLRPDTGDKSFQAQLVDIQDIDKFAAQNYQVQDDLVLVSTPKTIKGEYRFVVAPSCGIIAHSTYRYQGLVTKIPAVPKGARKKCEEVLARNWNPDPVYVVDIAEDADGDFWLLELNSFSSAGLYECNKKAIVDKVSAIAKEQFEQFRITHTLQP